MSDIIQSFWYCFILCGTLSATQHTSAKDNLEKLDDYTTYMTSLSWQELRQFPLEKYLASIESQELKTILLYRFSFYTCFKLHDLQDLTDVDLEQEIMNMNEMIKQNFQTLSISNVNKMTLYDVILECLISKDDVDLDHVDNILSYPYMTTYKTRGTNWIRYNPNFRARIQYFVKKMSRLQEKV